MDRSILRASLQRAVLEGAWLRAVGGCRRRLILLLLRQPSASAAASWGSLAPTPYLCWATKRSSGSRNGSPVGTGIVDLLVMSPETQDLHDALVFEHLIDKPMLNVDAP